MGEWILAEICLAVLSVLYCITSERIVQFRRRSLCLPLLITHEKGKNTLEALGELV
jgi:hypothetical protein